MNDNTNKVTREFNALGLLLRFLFALALVLLTFNPSGTSAYHWISSAIGAGTFGPLHLIAIIVLAIGWVIVWVATWRALDTLGVVLAALALGAIVWLFVDLGWIATDSVSSMTWIVLVCIAVVLGIGMSWAHIWRRMTGQYSVEPVDD